MKKAKLKETKKTDSKKVIQQTQDTVSVRTALITICTIIVVFVSFYFLTDYLVSKRTKPTNNTSNTNTNTNVIAFQDLLKKDSKEYYVLAIMDEKDEDYYKLYVRLTGKTNYTIDMNDAMNKSYIGKETSIGEKVKDIKISDSTLFVIKDGKISEHYVGKNKISEYLKKNFKELKSN